MTITTGSSANFRVPSGSDETLRNTLQRSPGKPTELAKALLLPGMFVEK